MHGDGDRSTPNRRIVDIKQNARQTNIRAEQIDLLPRGRDFTTLVTQAPGANQESKLGGLSIDGASAGENRYIIDGIETTNLQNGLSGKSLIVDFVDEVQVKSSGYTAEYGGATGGVINAITKSGIERVPRVRALLHPGIRHDRRSAGRPCVRSSPTRVKRNTSRIRKTTKRASSRASRSVARSPPTGRGSSAPTSPR